MEKCDFSHPHIFNSLLAQDQPHTATPGALIPFQIARLTDKTAGRTPDRGKFCRAMRTASVGFLNRFSAIMTKVVVNFIFIYSVVAHYINCSGI